MNFSSNWLLLQLSDSAFPIGAFAHSAGLEAAWHSGEVQNEDDFKKFLAEVLWQAGYGSLPLVNTAYDHPERLNEFDEVADVFLNNSVANRASRTQGRTFLSTCVRCFDLEFLSPMMREKSSYMHYAPVFGFVMEALDIERESMQRLFLHGVIRSVNSAAVRLGLIGCYQTQRIQRNFSSKLDEVILRCRNFAIRDLAQVSPLIDICQSMQNRLYSRLFQS